MSELYNVVFRGDILPGHNLPDVKARMSQLFKLDDARLATVFSGKPVVLKKDCDLATAEKIKAALTKSGADSDIKPVAAPQPNPASIAAPKPVVQPQPSIAKPAAVTSTLAGSAPTSSFAPAAAGIKLAPVGPVMTEAERAAQRKAPVQVKTDHIVLEKRASSFMAADEKPSVSKRPEINAPDFGVAPVGADLLKENEKQFHEELELDLSRYEVAEVGADMLREDEKLPLPVMEIEELNVDLAPPGADMGQLKKAPPPPPPKTDHLKVV